MRNGEPPFLNGTLGADTLPHGSRLTPVSAIRTLELRSRRIRGRRFKVGSVERPEPGGRPVSDGSGDTWLKSPGGSAQPSSPATDVQGRSHLPWASSPQPPCPGIVWPQSWSEDSPQGNDLLPHLDCAPLASLGIQPFFGIRVPKKRYGQEGH